jgi:hypothetical protein
MRGDILHNVATIRDYGWRGGCPAAGVAEDGFGSGAWLDIPWQRSPLKLRKAEGSSM